MNSTIRWPDKTLPIEIHCAPGVLTGLEIIAADGLLAMPRIGLGVGGLLLGRRKNERIEILSSVEIPCSHALGPAFILTPQEIASSAGLRGKGPDPANGRANETAADGSEEQVGPEVVGWYCSKPSPVKAPGPMTLSEHDQTVLDTLCPGRLQVALLIRPSIGKTTTAVFGFRQTNESGSSFLLGAAQELAWQELVAYQEPGRKAVAAPEPGLGSEETISDRVTHDVAHPAFLPVPMARSGTLFGTTDPAFGTTEPEAEVGKARRWPLRLFIAIAVLAILTAAAFFIRGYWLPRPTIALIASSDWTGRVSVLWNGEALSGLEGATLVIEDSSSGPLHTIHLSGGNVRAGSYQYDCRPGGVTATLLAGDLSDTISLRVRAETYLPESGISK